MGVEKNKNESVFAKNLIALREKIGITRSELARRLEVNINTFTGYELLGNEPKYEMLVKIADYFNVSVDELVREKGNVTAYGNKKKIYTTRSIVGNNIDSEYLERTAVLNAKGMVEHLRKENEEKKLNANYIELQFIGSLAE